MIISISAKGQVAFNELKEKYKSDDYVILSKYKKLTININKEGKLEIISDDEEKRMFLNKKAGMYSDDEILYSGFWELENISAYTEIPNNKKYKKIKVKEFEYEKLISDDVFHDDFKKTKFYYSSLRERAIATKSYRMILKEPRLLKSFFFQSIFPILEANFIIDADENIELGFAEFNTEAYSIQSKEDKEKGRKIYQFFAKDIERLEYEENIGSFTYFIPHIIPYIKSYNVNDSAVYLLNSIDGLYRWYISLVSQTDYSGTGELANEATEIVKDIYSEVDKAKAVFKWVQQNIKYIAIEDGLGGFIPDAPHKVFNKRYGDCKGKSVLLIEMLKAVGIKSYLTWVGTTSIPYIYKENPTPSVDNHMIVTYITPGGEYYYLDATNQNIIFGLPTAFIQGKEALISMGDTYQIKKIPVYGSSNSQLTDSVIFEIDGNNLKGTGKASITGYLYSDTKNFYDRQSDVGKRREYYIGFLNKGNNKFSIDSFKENVDPEKYKYQVEYDFSIGDYISGNENELFINMNLFKYVLTKKIKKTDKYEKHFTNHISYDFYFTLKIPEDRQVDYMPKNEEFSNSMYNYKIEYADRGNEIHYHFFISYNTLILKKEDFRLYNDLIESLYKSYRNSVSLVRKER